jgi:hypothetical protein
VSQIDIHYNDLSHKRKKSLDSQFIAKLCHKNIILEKVQTIVMAFNLHPCYTCVLHYCCPMGPRGKAIFKFAKFIYIYKRPLHDWIIRSTTCVLWETGIPFVSTWIHHPGFGWRSYCLLYYIVICLRSNLVPNIASVSILLIHDWLLRLLSIVYFVTIFSREEYRFPK